MQRSLENAYECVVAYSQKLPQVCATSLPSSWILDPVLFQELRCPGAPTEATGLLKVQKQSLAYKSCLPSLCRSCLCVNAYFKVCVSALCPKKPGVPREGNGVQLGEPLAKRAHVLSLAPWGRVPHCTDTEIPVKEKQSSSWGVTGLCSSHWGWFLTWNNVGKCSAWQCRKLIRRLSRPNSCAVPRAWEIFFLCACVQL